MSDVITLRDYQSEAVRAVKQHYAAGVSRQLIVLPTGSGKTIIIAHLVADLKIPTLILVHRDELISQTLEKLQMIAPATQVGIVKGDLNDLNRPITLASVQTLSRASRLKQVGREAFGFIVVDEAHHAVAPQWRRILRHVHAGENNLLLGVTATPVRADGVGMGNVFQKVVYQKAIPEMIRAGYLCPPKGLLVRSETDITNVRQSSSVASYGDFQPTVLEKVINTANRNQLITNVFKRYAANRKAIVFTAGVKHAHDLSATFQKNGITSAAVDGSMGLEERRRILKNFREGRIQAITNCNVLTEGFDEPATDCIIMARPTRSETLYIQAVGRGLRPYPGKKNCLVLDVADVSGQHSLVQLPDLMGPDWVERAKRKRQQAASESTQQENNIFAGFQPVGVGKALITREVNLITKYNWIKVKGVWVLPLENNSAVMLFPVEGGYLPVFSSGKRRERLHDRPLTIEWAQGIAEGKAREIHQGSSALVQKAAPWRDLPATEKQKNLLKKMRIRGRHKIKTRGEASDVINRVFWGRKAARMLTKKG